MNQINWKSIVFILSFLCLLNYFQQADTIRSDFGFGSGPLIKRLNAGKGIHLPRVITPVSGLPPEIPFKEGADQTKDTESEDSTKLKHRLPHHKSKRFAHEQKAPLISVGHRNKRMGSRSQFHGDRELLSQLTSKLSHVKKAESFKEPERSLKATNVMVPELDEGDNLDDENKRSKQEFLVEKQNEIESSPEDETDSNEEDFCAQKETAQFGCYSSTGEFLEDLCSEEKAAEWLDDYTEKDMWMSYKLQVSYWDYETNVTDLNEAKVFLYYDFII